MCLGVSTIYMAMNVSFWFLQNPKKTLNPFEVMLKLVVSCHIATGNRKVFSLWKSNQTCLFVFLPALPLSRTSIVIFLDKDNLMLL